MTTTSRRLRLAGASSMAASIGRTGSPRVDRGDRVSELDRIIDDVNQALPAVD